MRGWWERRDDPNVLWLFFEDLAEDLPRSVARIAAWLGVPCDAALLARVCALSSFDFMSAEVSMAIAVVACPPSTSRHPSPKPGTLTLTLTLTLL